MMEEEPKLAVITGADGGMGTEITRAVALAGYRVIMASCRLSKAEEVRHKLLQERDGLRLEIRELDLASQARWKRAGILPKMDWNVPLA